MHLRGLLILLTLLPAVLAGCTSNEEPASLDLTSQEEEQDQGTGAPTDAGDDDVGAGATDANETEAPGGAETDANTLPSAALSLSADEVAAGEEVDVTIEGSDEDGDELTWTLDVGNDGEADAQGSGDDLPYNHTVAFEEVGEHEIVLTMSDGTDEVVDTTTLVVVAAGYGGPEPRSWDGETFGAVFCFPDSYPTYGPDVIGWSYAVEPAGTGFAVEFWAGDETVVETGGETGVVPEGTDNFGVCVDAPASAPVSYTLTMYAPGHPDAPEL